MDVGPIEQLTHSTVRIETTFKSKRGLSTGTGFFMEFSTDTNTSYPVIITNKHVIVDASKGKLYFSSRRGG